MKRAILALVIVGASVLLLAVNCVPALFVNYVTYDGNGNTGGDPPVDENEYRNGATVTVLDHGTLERTGYIFEDWNTSAGGSGTTYEPGDTFLIERDDVTLFAQWREMTLQELLVGTWSGPNVLPGYGDVYLETIIRSDGTIDGLMRPEPGGPLLDDLCMRGTYTLDESTLNTQYTEMWCFGEWHTKDSFILQTSSLDLDQIANGTWVTEPDFNEDGTPDASWTLAKQAEPSPPSSGNEIIWFFFSGYDNPGLVDDAEGVIDGTSVLVTVPSGSDRSALVPWISIWGVAISPKSGVAQDFTSPVSYTVTAEDGTTQDTVVTVEVAD